MDFGQQYVGLAAVLGLLGATLWWLRRRGFAAFSTAGRRGARLLEPIERLALSPQHSLHLVRLGETVVLLGCSPGGCAVLQRLPRLPESGR